MFLNDTNRQINAGHGTPIATLDDAHDVLSWRAVDVPLYFPTAPKDAGGVLQKSTDSKAIVRDDTGAQIATVGTGFTIFSNEKFIESIRPWVESGQLTPMAIGEFNGGATTWIQLRINGASADIKPGDRFDGTIVIQNGHGTVGHAVLQRLLRLVCTNGMMAVGWGNLASRRHTSRMASNGSAERVDEAIDGALDTFGDTVDIYRKMADVQLPDEDAGTYFRRVFATPAERALDPTEFANLIRREDDKPPRAVATVADLYHAGTQGGGATVYGAVNAVTEYVDHHRGRDASRAQAAMMGAGRAVAATAFADGRALLDNLLTR